MAKPGKGTKKDKSLKRDYKQAPKKEGKSTAVVFIKTPIFLFNKSLDCI